MKRIDLKNEGFPANNDDYIELAAQDFRDPTVFEATLKNFSRARLFEKVISEAQLNELYAFAFSRCHHVRHHDGGTIFIYGNLRSCFHIIKDVLCGLVPELERSPVVGGNFFITGSPHGIHNDSLPLGEDRSLSIEVQKALRGRWIQWKTIIIPMWMAPKAAQGNFFLFEQRHIGEPHVYYHGFEGQLATAYPVVRDMDEVDFYNSDGLLIKRPADQRPFDIQLYEKYFYDSLKKKNHPRYESFHGLTVEEIFDWNPGSAIIFDTFQLHCANRGLRHSLGWQTKMGLRLSFLKEL